MQNIPGLSWTFPALQWGRDHSIAETMPDMSGVAMHVLLQ
jgi:hypothetical protein